MDIILPTIPAGVLVLLALLAPYVQALIQRPSWSPAVKKVAAVVVALVLTGVVLGFYYVYTGDTVPEWPVLALLAIVVAQASYTMVTKSSATALELRTSRDVVLSQDEDGTWRDPAVRDRVLADFAKLDPDEQNTTMQNAIAVTSGE